MIREIKNVYLINIVFPISNEEYGPVSWIDYDVVVLISNTTS